LGKSPPDFGLGKGFGLEDLLHELVELMLVLPWPIVPLELALVTVRYSVQIPVKLLLSPQDHFAGKEMNSSPFSIGSKRPVRDPEQSNLT
jgi:hypothetical protein